MKELTEGLYQEYFEALILGDRFTCQDIVKSLLSPTIAIYELYEQLFKRALYQVGELWETNQISVATEHLATSLTESLLNLVYPYIFSTDRMGKSVVLACVSKELHPIGAKMVADIFEMHGWDSYFLGANVPNSALLSLIDEKKPDLLGLSISLYFNMSALKATLEIVKQTHPDLPVIVGGQAFLWGGKEILDPYQNIQYVSSLESLIDNVIRT